MKKIIIGLVALSSLTAFAKSDKLINPFEPTTKLPFSAQNVQRLDGVCKSLGYQSYVFDTARRTAHLEDSVLVNADGLIAAMPKFETISEIECEGTSSLPSQQKIITQKNPANKETGLRYSIRNAQSFDGVCRQLGHSGYVEASARRTGHNEDTVVVDSEGSTTIVKDWFESLAELSCYL